MKNTNSRTSRKQLNFSNGCICIQNILKRGNTLAPPMPCDCGRLNTQTILHLGLPSTGSREDSSNMSTPTSSLLSGSWPLLRSLYDEDSGSCPVLLQSKRDKDIHMLARGSFPRVLRRKYWSTHHLAAPGIRALL